MNIDAGTITTLIAIGGPIGSIFGLGWWLAGRFREIEAAQRDKADELARVHRAHLDDHERQDQDRHEENLERFRTISVSLAKLGASNGSSH